MFRPYGSPRDVQRYAHFVRVAALPVSHKLRTALVALAAGVNCLTVFMKLDRTNELIHGKLNEEEPYEALAHVLESVIELVQIPDNDFCWSPWDNSEEATKEIKKLLNIVKSYALPDRVEVGMLFAPTGPLQEVSLSSGWAELFLKVADKYDQVEKLLWPKS